jgi:hypothetical protein
MKRKTKLLLAVATLVALLLIASRCDSSPSGSPYSSGQHGSTMEAISATASAPTTPTQKE